MGKELTARTRRAEHQDADIMRLRTLARMRGATPAEIQRNVLALENKR